ncbi:helix-turn-helix transcriptional regulator [Synechococcus sp. KORDI-100]|uniref:helix-turn-helix transcriptional regulator n=1 Tax=Synechococcus sp. KORDI-100 TaxID=1280380 RepID=UPI000A5CD40D|nr:helix-turn-helix transcriptional regulator [Synechococcus sp. KORDI-100]
MVTFQQRHFKTLKSFLLSSDIHGYAARDTLDALLVECFMRPDNISTAGIPLSNRAELMRDLLNYGFSNPTEAISLETLSKTLLKSPSSITKASREQFGVSPMQLLKQIRLQQVQNLLTDPEQQQQLGTLSIHAIAKRFGFTAPNHFARDYKTMFGENPGQTFSREKA